MTHPEAGPEMEPEPIWCRGERPFSSTIYNLILESVLEDWSKGDLDGKETSGRWSSALKGHNSGVCYGEP